MPSFCEKTAPAGCLPLPACGVQKNGSGLAAAMSFYDLPGQFRGKKS
jgi:hypothetical protein